MRPWTLRKIGSASLACLGLIISTLDANETDFFPIPSPHEILNAAKREGLNVNVPVSALSVLRENLSDKAKQQPHQTAFKIGRIFSIAGFSFSQLNNDIVLKLVEKVFSAARNLDLPQNVAHEIETTYDLIQKQSSWDRDQLTLSFSSARSKFLYLLKDSTELKPRDQKQVFSLGVALECGLWLQSLSVASQGLREEQYSAFVDIYLDPDYLNYFQRSLEKTDLDKQAFLSQLKRINQHCQRSASDQRLTSKELSTLQSLLKEVL
jgi:hypothetical protein